METLWRHTRWLSPSISEKNKQVLLVGGERRISLLLSPSGGGTDAETLITQGLLFWHYSGRVEQGDKSFGSWENTVTLT